MKKIVALVLSLVMALSLCTVAFAYDNGDEFYDAMTDGSAKKYTYVSKEYKADGTTASNHVPYLVGPSGAWFKIATSGTVLYKDGKATDLYLGDQIKEGEDGGLFYNYQAKTVAEAKWSCTTDAHKEGYTYTDENGATKYAVKKDGGSVKLLVDGKVITASTDAKDTGFVTGRHILYADKSTGKEVGVGIYEATCAACGKTIKFQTTKVTTGNYLYQDMTMDTDQWLKDSGVTAAKPAGKVWISGGVYIIGESKTDNNVKPVPSAKTFDAGVAMYVGMSLLSVAGGAVVIGKKKEF